MHLDALYLQNFRNYEQVELSFSPKANLIRGGNAQGKTNLLEAIYFLSTGRSFRTQELADCIRKGASSFYLEAHFMREGVSHAIKAHFDGNKRHVQYNDVTYAHFSHLLGLLPSVLYAPEDGSLITGAPAERRRFIDLHIAQTDPLYIQHLVRYFKAMKQRNYLLKNQTEHAIEPWEEMMSVAASYLVQKRQERIAALNAPLSSLMQLLSNGIDQIQVRYQPSHPLEEITVSAFRHAFATHRHKEMRLGSSLIGPHRDDLLIEINQLPAKTYSSEGQKRSCIAALRLAEWERLADLTGAPPLMSVDDFGIHLDESRRELLQMQLSRLGQVFLTSPDPREAPSPLAQKQILFVEQGKVFLPN